ncbi:MAG: methionyl-tRNA formyltransferase, partial [Planctomycetota bacterium]
MKIVYCGSASFGIPSLEGIKASNHDLVYVFTQCPHPAGRGRTLTPTPIANWARQNSVPFTETGNVNSDEIVEKIARCKPDLLLVIAFGQKISDRLIALPAKNAINVHASLLPKYRGAAPINWAIINGETGTGISIITLASKMDAGQILAQEKTHIADDETAQQLHDRLAQIAAPLLLQTIKSIQDGTAVYKAQDAALVTKAPKLKKPDGFIDFNDPAEKIRNEIRGLWPWPAAQADYVNRKTRKCCRVKIAKAKVVACQVPCSGHSGELDSELNVLCGHDKLK